MTTPLVFESENYLFILSKSHRPKNGPASILPACEHLAVYLGDSSTHQLVNSHSTECGNHSINDDGEQV